MTTSAHAHASRPCARSRTSSIPGRIDALNRPSIPPPVPPAAPDPGVCSISRPLYCMIACARFASPRSRRSTCVVVAPFCGANTWAAPSEPVNGLVTSQARIIGMFFTESGTSESSIFAKSARVPPPSGIAWSVESRKRNPSARANPVPPSVVALPPNPSTMRSAPASIAARISKPVPNVEVVSALRSAGEIRSSPLAEANSTTAVRRVQEAWLLPRKPYCAVIGRPIASTVSTSRNVPPVA